MRAAPSFCPKAWDEQPQGRTGSGCGQRAVRGGAGRDADGQPHSAPHSSGSGTTRDQARALRSSGVSAQPYGRPVTCPLCPLSTTSSSLCRDM